MLEDRSWELPLLQDCVVQASYHRQETEEEVSLRAPLQVGKPCLAAYQACLTLAQTRLPQPGEEVLGGHHWTPEAREWGREGMGPR